MKVLLISVGTRGDMEPFLAIGDILRNRGHEVKCVFPEQFRSLADDSDLPFASLGPEFIEMLDSNLAKDAMGGRISWLRRLIALIRLARKSQGVNKKLIKIQHQLLRLENPDRVVHSGKAIYPIIWGIFHAGQNIQISPVPFMHYVKDQAHVAFNRDFGPFLNRITYWIADFGLITTLRISIRWLKLRERISRRKLKDALATLKVIYTISPSLFHRPSYWPEQRKVLGFHERNKATNWHASPELQQFLRAHKKILFVSFGSMTNPNPEGNTRLIVSVLKNLGIPAIISAGAGGLVRPDESADFVHFEEQIPYDWIFPKMYAVVHHGGSGTTHMGLKHGCATLIIPHIIDQFVWNRVVNEKGAGPLGVKVAKLSEKRLEPLIHEVWSNSDYKKNAEKISKKMMSEELVEELYSAIVT